MLFTASLIVFFYCIFHYRQSLKLLGHKLFLDNNNTGTIFGKHKFVNKEDMSDEEFRDPLAAINHWNKIKEKKGFTPGNTSLFQWKKEPEVSDIVRNAKRPKITASCEEISDDQSDVSIIEDSVSKKVDSNKVCDDEDSTNNQNSKSEKSSFKNIKTLQYVKKIEKLKSFNKYTQAVSNASLPTGMPPIIAGVAVLFPITPYKSQISVMNAVIKGCKNSENCLLESPTGSGKTLALLCAALAWQSHFVRSLQKTVASLEKNNESMEPKKIQIPRIFYSSRTHKQIEQVIREFRKTAYAQIPMTVLSSREHSCIQPHSKGISKTQLCNDLLDPKTRGECTYYNNKHKIGMHCDLDSLEFDTPWDIEDLVELGRETGACPYFAAKSLMADSHIIFCPYNYLIDPFIRSTMQINLMGDVVIIDEGHNIEDICREIGSAEFREDQLTEAIQDCNSTFRARDSEAYKSISEYLTILKTLISDQELPVPMNRYEETTSNCWNGEQTWILLTTYNFDEYAYMQFMRSSEQAIADYKAVKEDLKMTSWKKEKNSITTVNFATMNLLEKLIDALRYIKNPEFSMSYRCTISERFYQNTKAPDGLWTRVKEGSRLRSLKFMCMNSAVVFGKMRQETRCVILASGTLSPTTSFESELSTKFPHKVHANHVVDKSQVYVRAIGRGPNGVCLKATYQNIQTLLFKDDLGLLIEQVCETIPHGILCFFSSYSALKTNMERWQSTDQWERLSKCKRLFVEPRHHRELDDIMIEYREAVDETGALLFAVFRGKVAEGIDFSDNIARCVITIGIPFAVQNTPEIWLKRQYNDVNQNQGLLSGQEWYTVQAYRALNQALGRCIRHKNDWGAILLVDDRLQNSVSANYLSKWVREMKLCSLDYNLQEELKVFVKNQESLSQ